MQLTDLNIGVLFILGDFVDGRLRHRRWPDGLRTISTHAVGRLAQFGADDQLRAAELSLAIAAPLLISNTLSLRGHCRFAKAGSILHWNILGGGQIVGFILFIIAAFAETNRIPFDLPVAENELVAGFHVEYSSMKFASFFMAEYANMVTVSCMASILFLGGWMAPFPEKYGSSLVPSLLFLVTALVLFFHAATAVRLRDKKSYPAFGILFLLMAALFLLCLWCRRGSSRYSGSAPKWAAFSSYLCGSARPCRDSATTS